MDYSRDGIPISETVRHDLEAVHFYCRTCHRSVSKTPNELLQIASATTGLWVLARKLRCIECNQKDFTVRLGKPRNCPGA